MNFGEEGSENELTNEDTILVACAMLEICPTLISWEATTCAFLPALSSTTNILYTFKIHGLVMATKSF